jgi:hypothetical protein
MQEDLSDDLGLGEESEDEHGCIASRASQGVEEVAGIRWGHLFWILPFVGYPWLATMVIVPYVIAGIFASGLSSLRLDPSSFFLGPVLSALLSPNGIWRVMVVVLLIAAVFVTVQSLRRFVAAMQHTRTSGRFWRVLVFGVGAPIVAWTIAFLGVGMTHLRSPVGDWVVVACLVVGFLFLLPTLKAAALGD